MAKGTKNKPSKEKRKQADRRREDRRQGDQLTTKALFSAYGFKEERHDSRRDDKDRRED